MGRGELDSAVLSVGRENREFLVPRSRSHAYAMLEELRFVRGEAQAEANHSYAAWRPGSCSGDAYVVYRAAQDRADAAQDALADWVRRIA